MTTAAPQIRRGGDAAQEAADAGGGKFAKVNYFSLDENKSMVVRFLTDSPDWFYVKQHPSCPTKNKPADFKGNWPPSMPAVCRHDDAFKTFYSDCYICDTPVMSPHDPTKALKPAIRVWALAVEREAVVDNGVVKGYRDVKEEVPARDAKGEVIENAPPVKQIKILVVNMGMKNFFSGLQGIYGLFNTVCSRDMMIRRSGTGLTTDYQIIPLDEIATHKGPIFTVQFDSAGIEVGRTIIAPATESWAKYEKAIEDQNLDLGRLIADRASDEYYARFFDPSKTPQPTAATGQSGQATQQAASQPAAPAGDVVDQDRLAAMAARVTGTGNNAAAAPPAAQEAAPAAPPTEAAPPAPEPAAAATGPVNYDD